MKQLYCLHSETMLCVFRIGVENGLSPSPCRSPSDVASSPGGRLHNPALKSFLYKSDSEYDVSPKSLSHNSSLTANDG